MRSAFRFISIVLAAGILVAPHAQGATLAPVNVLSDPSGDHPLGDDATPLGSASDIVGGAIGETDDAIQLVWQVADLRDELAPPVPMITILYFEFQLSNPINGATGLFSVRARLYPDEPRPSTGDPTNVPSPQVPPTWPWGGLYSNCQTTGNVVSCTYNQQAPVTVTADVAANTITASVPRAFLKSNNGQELAVDGATLQDQQLFRGVANCVSTVAVIAADLCDLAVMDDSYTLGSARE